MPVKHKIGLTVSDPNHPSVPQRKEKVNKTVNFESSQDHDEDSAVAAVKRSYKKKGYRIHDAWYIKTVRSIKEEFTKNTTAGEVIKDFQQSDAPQFKNKSKEKIKQMALAAFMSKQNESVELEEGISKQHPIEGHPYHSKTNDQLHFIIKDAGAAAKAQKGMSSEGKYLDQQNDAATVLGFRKRAAHPKTGNLPNWYLNKYFPKAGVNEEVELEESSVNGGHGPRIHWNKLDTHSGPVKVVRNGKLISYGTAKDGNYHGTKLKDLVIHNKCTIHPIKTKSESVELEESTVAGGQLVGTWEFNPPKSYKGNKVGDRHLVKHGTYYSIHADDDQYSRIDSGTLSRMMDRLKHTHKPKLPAVKEDMDCRVCGQTPCNCTHIEEAISPELQRGLNMLKHDGYSKHVQSKNHHIEVHFHGTDGYGVTHRNNAGKTFGETKHFDKHEDAVSHANQLAKKHFVGVHDMTESVDASTVLNATVARHKLKQIEKSGKNKFQDLYNKLVRKANSDKQVKEETEIEESKTLGSTPKTKERNRIRMKELMMKLIKGTITSDQKKYLQHVTKSALSPAHAGLAMEETNPEEDLSGNAYEMGHRAGSAYKSKHSNPFIGKNKYNKESDWHDGWKQGMKDSGNDLDEAFDPHKKKHPNGGTVMTLVDYFKKNENGDPLLVTHFKPNRNPGKIQRGRMKGYDVASSHDPVEAEKNKQEYAKKWGYHALKHLGEEVLEEGGYSIARALRVPGAEKTAPTHGTLNPKKKKTGGTGDIRPGQLTQDELKALISQRLGVKFPSNKKNK